MHQRHTALNQRLYLPLPLFIFISAVTLFLSGTLHRLSAADSVVLFNEIQYQPTTPAAEWIEFHNPMAVHVDLSGWSISQGVTYTFPQGTVLFGRGYLVVAADPDSLRQATGQTNILGPFSGRLANEGERLTLINHNGRVMDSLAYSSTAPWSVIPAGSDFTLSKRQAHLPSDEPAHWEASAQTDGTPTQPNVVAPAFTTDLRISQLNTSPFISEVPAAGTHAFWVEISHANSSPAQLDNARIMWIGSTSHSWTLPDTLTLEPGEAYVLNLTLPNGSDVVPEEGDRILLLSSDGQLPLDGIRVGPRPMARAATRNHRWQAPSNLTPGAPNEFRLNDAIRINEIHYHPASLPSLATSGNPEVILPWDATWRFRDDNINLGVSWLQPAFPDQTWKEGGATFFHEESSLPLPKVTPLNLGPTTCYFRTTFLLEEIPDNSTLLDVRLLVDDGVIVYLNGVEVLRSNMPEGSISHATFATTGIDNATVTGPYRIPSASLRSGTNVLAVEIHQASSNSSDMVFALELSMTPPLPPDDPTSPEGAVQPTWVELFNSSNEPVALDGWSFQQGIRFTFPTDTILGSGDFLVLTDNLTEFETLHPDISVPVHGPFEGRLSRSSDYLTLVDATGNLVDEALYYDTAPWPSMADGYASSLERRDPRADGTHPDSWAESVETDRFTWQTIVHEAVAQPDGGPTRWNEFVIGLLGEGEVWIDEIRVIESPGTANARERLSQPILDPASRPWRFRGNHRLSELIPHPELPGRHLLRVVASGATEHMHNHIETTFAGNEPIINGRTYRVEMRARWIRGIPRLHSRLYFNRVAHAAIPELPLSSGTPGKTNTQYTPNMGPSLRHLRHQPLVPSAGQAVTVSAQAEDPDSVQSLTLWWTSGAGIWRNLPMSESGPGRYSTTVPGQAANAQIQFYVEAKDAAGATSFLPRGGRNSRALWTVSNLVHSPTALVRSIRLLMTPNDSNFQFATTNLMSNESLSGTLLMEPDLAFYDVGVRLHSSQRGRGDQRRVGFTVQFPVDQPFRSDHTSITFDRSGGYSGRGGRSDEIVLRHILNQAGGIPDSYHDLVRLHFPRPLDGRTDGTVQMVLAKYRDSYLDDRWPDGSDGPLYKMELVYYPLTSVNNDPRQPKLPNPDEVVGSELVDLGSNPESYRWFYLLENKAREDDFAPAISLARTFSLSGNAFHQAIDSVIDVDQWLRFFAAKSLSGDVDTFGFGYPHNQVFYFRPTDGRAEALPWDMDFSWTRSPTSGLLPSGSVRRLMDHPARLRRFHFHLLDIMNTSFNSDYITPWLQHYGQVAGENYGGLLSYILQRSASVRSQLGEESSFIIQPPPSPLVDNNRITLTGTAWVDIEDLHLVLGSDTYQVEWITPTQWRASIPLILGQNAVELIGTRSHTNNPAPVSISLTSTQIAPAVDTDDDGMPDAWEREHGLNPEIDDAEDDEDEDGQTNIQEYIAGTDPQDATDWLRLEFDVLNTTTADGDGPVQLRFMAQPGRAYRIHSVTPATGSSPGSREVLTTFPPSAVPVMRSWEPENSISRSEFRLFQLSTP